MIAACSLLRRRSADSVDVFKKHWLEVHGPLAAELHGVKRYLQSHFDNEAADTTDAARAINVNGLAEMWFEDEADRQVCYDSEQEKACDVDSLLFIGATARLVTDVVPHVPLSGKPARFKNVFLVLERGQPEKTIDFAELTRRGGFQGLIEHKVTKAGAAPTQKRESVDVSIRRIITAASDNADDIVIARKIISDGGKDPNVAAFSCVEYYLV